MPSKPKEDWKKITNIAVEHARATNREHMDSFTTECVQRIIHDSMELVIHNLTEQYDAQELPFIINKINGNLVNFMGLTVSQLVAFGTGHNDGPFIRLVDELLERTRH